MKPRTIALVLLFFLAIPYLESRNSELEDLEFVRLDSNHFSTRAWVLVSQEQPAILVLIGVVHIGEPSYYHQLKDILHDCDLVYYEGIQWDDGWDRVGSGEWIGSNMIGWNGELDRIREMQLEYSERLGLVDQNSILLPESHWQNADASIDEFNRIVREYNERILSLDKKSNETEGMENKELEPEKQLETDPIIRQRLYLATEIANSARKINSEAYKDAFELLVYKRNRIAMKKISSSFGEASTIGLLYGAAHMPDFLNTLQKKWGYQVVNHKWIPAWSLK